MSVALKSESATTAELFCTLQGKNKLGPCLPTPTPQWYAESLSQLASKLSPSDTPGAQAALTRLGVLQTQKPTAGSVRRGPQLRLGQDEGQPALTLLADGASGISGLRGCRARQQAGQQPLLMPISARKPNPPRISPAFPSFPLTHFRGNVLGPLLETSVPRSTTPVTRGVTAHSSPTFPCRYPAVLQSCGIYLQFILQNETGLKPVYSGTREGPASPEPLVPLSTKPVIRRAQSMRQQLVPVRSARLRDPGCSCFP